MAERRMTGGELRVAREFLGLDHEGMGAALGGTHPATVQRWEWGQAPIPLPVLDEVRELQAITQGNVDRLAARLRANPEETIPVWSEKDKLPPDSDVARYGPHWWRMVVARATQDLPDAHIGTFAEIMKNGDDWWTAITTKPGWTPPSTDD